MIMGSGRRVKTILMVTIIILMQEKRIQRKRVPATWYWYPIRILKRATSR